MTTLNYESCQISGMNRENYFKSGSYDIQIFIRYVFFSLNVVGKWRQLENRVMQNIQYCVRCDATKTLNVSLLSSPLLTASSWSVINDRYFIYLFMPSNRLFVCICHKQPNGEVVLFYTCICVYVLKPLKEILFDSTSLGCLFQVPSRIYFLFFAKLAPYHFLSISGQEKMKYQISNTSLFL